MTDVAKGGGKGSSYDNSLTASPGGCGGGGGGNASPKGGAPSNQPSYSQAQSYGYKARRSSAEHLIATKALRCAATAWSLTVAESFAKF